MRLVYLFLLLCYFSSCLRHDTRLFFFNTNNFILVDSTAEARKFLSANNHNSDYPIYFIGSISDTIKIGKRYWEGRIKWNENSGFSLSRCFSERTLKLFVDTSVKTNSPMEYLSGNKITAEDSTKNYRSFLLIIQNISDSIIYLGRTFSLFFICREAKNKNGDWVKIDMTLHDQGICLTDQPGLFLKQNEILISKVRRYRGPFATDFRLVFGYENNLVYSNIFRDSIDERFLQNISKAE